jgi:hypothetical protein
MATSTLKRNTFRLYLNEQDTLLMHKAAEVTELGQSELMSKLMSAALRAVAANDYRLPLPLKFRIAEGLPEDRKPTTKIKR